MKFYMLEMFYTKCTNMCFLHNIVSHLSLLVAIFFCNHLVYHPLKRANGYGYLGTTKILQIFLGNRVFSCKTMDYCLSTSIFSNIRTMKKCHKIIFIGIMISNICVFVNASTLYFYLWCPLLQI